MWEEVIKGSGISLLQGCPSRVQFNSRPFVILFKVTHHYERGLISVLLVQNGPMGTATVCESSVIEWRFYSESVC